MTISTMMAVKTSATRVQPPSDRVLTCRKKMVWTAIWAKARTVISMAVHWTLSTPVIASQKGMAVRTADSRKPVR